MKNFKKVIAVLCSATMVLGSSITAFAADPSSTAGDGNILVFSVETVTVPTSVKIAFNPNGYTVQGSTNSGSATTTNQIVSLKYGIASTANKDRKVTVSFTATGVKASGHTGTGEVVFVDDVKKAQAYNKDSNTDGADYGEYKIYLDVAAAAAAPTDNTTAFTVADGASTATAAKLADATFTAATKGMAPFSGNATKAEAAIAYKLDKATYEQKTGDDGKIDFDTTQDQMAGKFDLKALGTNGVVGFTFTGAMNPNADWTKAEITALKIQPEYEIKDIDGTEEALGENGGLGQIKVAATDDYKMVKANGAFSYTFKSAPTGSITAFTVDGTTKFAAVTAGNVTYANNTLTINATATTNMGLATGNHTIKATIGGAEKTLTITN